MRRTFRLTIDVTYDVPGKIDDETLVAMADDIRYQLMDIGSAAQIRGQLDVGGALAIITSPSVEELL